jgi:hypothetical protein
MCDSSGRKASPIARRPSGGRLATQRLQYVPDLISDSDERGTMKLTFQLRKSS